MANSETSVQVTLLVSKVFVPQENKTMVIVFCPELDTEGFGASREEAEKNLRENLKINVIMAKAQGFLNDKLLSLGWTEGKGGKFTPPEITVEKVSVTL